MLAPHMAVNRHTSTGLARELEQAVPGTVVDLARARAGLLPARGLAPVDPDRPSVLAAGAAAELSFRAWYEPVEPLAACLREAGLCRGDRVAILSETRMEWLQADCAALAAGCVTVPIYPTLPAPRIEQILEGSLARAVFVSRPALLEELLAAPSSRGLRLVVVMAPGSPERVERAIAEGAEARVLSWEEAIAHGRRPEILARAANDPVRLEPADIATLIYTSGTSGEMRGVLLSHANLLASATASAQRIEITSSDVYLSFLPMSHVLERVVHLSMLWAGARIHYSEGLDRLERDFRRVRPTVVVGVPRLFEKILTEAEEKSRRRGRHVRLLFRMAERAAIRAGRRGPGSRPGGPSGWLWDALVYRRVRRGLGGRVRVLISGGAPLGRRETSFLNGAGLGLLEGYGLTETSSVAAVNTRREWRLGSVGRPIPGLEVRIAPDGEILVRGPSVMQGYDGQEVATRDALRDGWLHTGDLGRVDADGFLYIIDRKKDLIVTAHGKKVAPQLVEACLRGSPLVREVAVIGDRRPYLVALIYPDLDRLRGRLDLSLSDDADLARILNAPSVRAAMRAEIDRHTDGLAPHEIVRDFVLLPRVPEVADGGLTPTLKLRRRELERRHAREIARLYPRSRR